jgi:xylulose-5-phosphate/fructose-6-phosphate phosphoketolase
VLYSLRSLQVVLNHVSRFHLAQMIVKNSRRPLPNAAALTADCQKRIEEAKAYSIEHMEDQPDIANFKWTH